jgi:hypothetical protein
MRWSEDDVKKLLGDKYILPNTRIIQKKSTLPGPVPGAFQDRYKNSWERRLAWNRGVSVPEKETLKN